MNRLVFLFFFVALLFSACVPTSTLGPGQDAAYVNNRKDPTAQMSEEEAEQYALQREQVLEEMEMDKRKRNERIDQVQSTFDLIDDVRGRFY